MKLKAKSALERHGIDNICLDIVNGKSMSAIAEDLGISLGSLIAWLSTDAERSARVTAARASTAKLWDEKAEAVIKGAHDWMDLHKARELAQHYRWRASKIAPKEYGDKLNLEHSGGVEVKKVEVEIIKPKE